MGAKYSYRVWEEFAGQLVFVFLQFQAWAQARRRRVGRRVGQSVGRAGGLG
jgi:hypothetical protein